MNKTISIQIRPAEPEDVKASRNVLILGKMYFLKSEIDGKLSGPYFISDYTDVPEFVTWFIKKMVWVALSGLDNDIKEINN